MNQEQISRLEALRLERERKTKQVQLDKKLKQLIPESYSFLSHQDSDEILLKSDEWPKDKWENKLYLQTDLKHEDKVTKVIKEFIALNPYNYSYLLFSNYNSGLVMVNNQALLNNWTSLLEIDGDDIYLYIPGRQQFLCIDKTEEFIVGEESNGRKWIFEITYSDASLKHDLMKNST